MMHHDVTVLSDDIRGRMKMTEKHSKGVNGGVLLQEEEPFGGKVIQMPL